MIFLPAMDATVAGILKNSVGVERDSELFNFLNKSQL